jgi:TMEM175 potassium channel family protein
MQQEKETIRLEAFSDGVFAIAITLLVLEIKIPSHELVKAQGLGYSVAALWPSYLAFITSFATILVMWVNHHRIFTLIETSDHPFLYLNGLLLLFVTFFPFPTALMAEYLLHPEARLAANIYTGTVLAISLAFLAMWHHASRREGLLSTDVAVRTEIEKIAKQIRSGPLLYFIAFALSFLSEGASIGLCLALAVLFALRDLPARR